MMASMEQLSETWTAATEHCRAGRLHEAENACRQVLVADPSHAPAWDLLGAIACQSGRFADAISSYQQALAINPHCA
jgi:cytochrome c-type biogenesis protein CcmH/NrfG